MKQYDEKMIILRSLLKVYGYTDDEAVTAYAVVLQDCDVREIQDAAIEWAREEAKRFTPADLLKIIRKNKQAAIPDLGCEICGKPRITPHDGRTYHVCIDCDAEISSYDHDIRVRSMFIHWPVRQPRPEIAQYLDKRRRQSEC